MRTNIIGLLFIGVILFYSRTQLITILFPERLPASLYNSSRCAGKKLCGIVYLAPWCPACNMIIPSIKDYLVSSSAHPEYGMQVIVGRGKQPGENLNKATEIGENIMVDDDDAYGSKLDIEAYPSFYVIDSSNRIKMKGDEARNWLNKSFLKVTQ